MYKDSYVRTCTGTYDVARPDDLSLHLTNDYVQKSLAGFGKHEDGNKLSYAQVRCLRCHSRLLPSLPSMCFAAFHVLRCLPCASLPSMCFAAFHELRCLPRSSKASSMVSH